MVEIYGSQWTSKHGFEPDPLNVWATSLHDVTLTQVKAGLRRVTEGNYEYPPALPKFKKLCLQKSQDDHIRDIIAADKAKAKLLPKPASKKTARKYINQMKKNLGMIK